MRSPRTSATKGLSRFHNPEFTMLEFYQAFADYQDMMNQVEQLMVHVVDRTVGGRTVTFQGTELSFEPPFRRIRLLEALEAALGADPLQLSEKDLRDRAYKLKLTDLEGAGQGKTAGQALRGLGPTRPPAADLRHGLPQGAQPSGQGAPGTFRSHGAFRAFRRGSGAGQRFLGVERSNRSAREVRGPGQTARAKGTTKPNRSTRITSERWNTAFRPLAVWGWVWTASPCFSQTRRRSGT